MRKTDIQSITDTDGILQWATEHIQEQIETELFLYAMGVYDLVMVYGNPGKLSFEELLDEGLCSGEIYSRLQTLVEDADDLEKRIGLKYPADLEDLEPFSRLGQEAYDQMLTEALDRVLYKALENIEQDRELMLLRNRRAGFV